MGMFEPLPTPLTHPSSPLSLQQSITGQQRGSGTVWVCKAATTIPSFPLPHLFHSSTKLLVSSRVGMEVRLCTSHYDNPCISLATKQRLPPPPPQSNSLPLHLLLCFSTRLPLSRQMATLHGFE